MRQGLCYEFVGPPAPVGSGLKNSPAEGGGATHGRDAHATARSLRHAELVQGSGDLGGLAGGGPAEDLAGDFGEFRQGRLGGPA